MQKGGVRFVTFSLIVLMFFASFVFAAHVVTLAGGGTEINVNEDVSTFFNISVNNSDNGQTSNITQVNITLPNSFTLANETNGTDVTGFDFVITGNVLSWSNLTHYLMNGTDINYFSFNASATTAGSFNISVMTVNATDTFLSNISVSVNDTTAPNVTLISPANDTSSTTNAYNFTFNVSDDSSVSNCSLTLNGTLYNFISTVSTTSENGMYNDSIATGVHLWNVTCTDSIAQVGTSETRTLTVSAASTSEESSSSSSSGGSGGSDITFRPTAERLEEGYTIGVQKTWKVKFDVDDVEHTLTVDDITETSVTVEVASNPQSATLRVGESEQFDADEDGFYDLNVELISITNKFNAQLVLTSLEGSPVAALSESESEDEDASETVASDDEASVELSDDVSEANEEKSGSGSLIIGILIVLIIAAGYYFFFMKKSKRK